MSGIQQINPEYNPLLSPSYEVNVLEDFNGTVAAATQLYAFGWGLSVAGSASVLNLGQDSTTPNTSGVLIARIPSPLTSRIGYALGGTAQQFFIPGFRQAIIEWGVKVDALGTPVTDEIAFFVGLMDNFSINADPRTGAYFYYNPAVSLNWIIGSAADFGGAGARTHVITTTPVVAGSYRKLRIVWDGTNFNYYIASYGGVFVLVGTIGTNIPGSTLSNRNTTLGIKASRPLLGSVIKDFYIDYARFVGNFIAPR